METPPFRPLKEEVSSDDETKSSSKEELKEWMDFIESCPVIKSTSGTKATGTNDQNEDKRESGIKVEVDPDKNLLKCPICLRQFDSYSAGVHRHIRSHENDGDLEVFYFVHEYTEKLKTRHGKPGSKIYESCKKVPDPDLPFKCDLCDKTWSSMKNLGKHRRRVHKCLKRSAENAGKLRKFPCLFCAHQANSFSDLEIHNRTHTGETPFECKGCHKRWKQLFLLRKSGNSYHPTPESRLQPRIHIKWNCEAAKKSGLKPPPCFPGRRTMTFDDEESSATPSADAQEHSGLNSEPKKERLKRFKCSKCEEMLISNYKKIEHEMSHGEQYPCKFCPAKFNFSPGLSRHMLKFHPEKMEDFPCNKCDMKFKAGHSLRKHKQRVHKQYYRTPIEKGGKRGRRSKTETRTFVEEVEKASATPEEIFVAPPEKDIKLEAEEVGTEGPSQDPLAPLKTETDPWTEVLLPL